MVFQPLLVTGVFLALTAALIGPVPPLLARASWTARSPRAALVLWQAIACTAGLSMLVASLAAAVAPLAVTYRHGLHVLLAQVLAGEPLRGLGVEHVLPLLWAGAVFGWLLLLLGRTATRNAQARREHRQRIDLLAEQSTTHNGVHVVDHPVAAAYCLPGLRPRVVITAGLVKLLHDEELAAVLEHERAHAQSRHHLVLLPFNALAGAFPFLPAVRLARDNAAQLVEMLADDHARSRYGGTVVARALLRLAAHRADHRQQAGGSSLPAGALGVAETAIMTRVRRLTDPIAPVAAWQKALVYATSAVLLTAPAALLVPCLS